MTTTNNHPARRGARGRLLALVAFPAAAAATPAPVPAPVDPGRRAAPRPARAAVDASRHMGILKATPDTGAAGRSSRSRAPGSPAGKQVSIVWMTSNVDWLLDARPDSVDYIGQQETKNVARRARHGDDRRVAAPSASR